MFRNKKISITTLIAICLCLLVAFGCSNNPENTDDFCFEHSYINGECEVCHAIDGGAIKYEFNNNSNSYEVVGLLSSYTPTEIVVLDEYNDGVNGKRDVTVVKENAFVANRFITKVVLPVTVKKIGANAFKECRALKTIIMTGVEELQNEDTFYNCLALEEIVVGDKFKAGREFTTNDIEHNPIADIFVKCGNSFSSKINFISNPDCFSGLLTGNVYYYSEENRCATWSYNQNGEIEKVEHEFENGACSDCGADDCDDLVYVYNSTDSCYYLLGFKKGFNDEEIVVLESVDDGIHGYGEVKGILDFAFYGNQKIKKLILSSTINYLGDQCFFGCSKLEYVNMGGFIETGRVPLQVFTNCYSFTKILVEPEFSMVDANIRYFTLFEKPFPQGCQLDFYVKASKKEECSTFLNTNLLIFAENTSSNMFSGNVYLYSEVYKENHWFYDVDGIPQLWNDN